MIITIPLEAAPNQTVSVMLKDIRWTIDLYTRLGALYATIANDNGVLVRNRVCLDGTFITQNLLFIDTDGNQDPYYTGLDGRFALVWTDES